MSTQKDLPMAGIHDPKTYHAMSAPFADGEAANQACHAFFDELRELRIKHRIADVLVVAMVEVGEADEHVPSTAMLQLGAAVNGEFMAAIALGSTSRDRANRVEKAILHGRKASR